MSRNKNWITALLMLVFIAGISVACSAYLTDSDPGKKGCRKCATPEPGTFINKRALVIVKNANQFAKNPRKSLKLTSKLSNMMEARVSQVRDTLVQVDTLNVRMKIYYPKAALKVSPAPMIYFIHGGAFMYGGIESYEMLIKKIAVETGCIVAAVEYRLAPEFPFPAGLYDCYAGYKWIAAHAAELGADPARITLMGDSAGGNLVAGTILLNFRFNGPPVHKQVLAYPSTSFVDTVYPSREYFSGKYGEPYLLSEELMREVKESYLRPGEDPLNPLISPLLSSPDKRWPATLLITAQCDPLRDEGRLYAEKLAEGGVDIRYHMYEGMIHGFLSFYSLLPDGKNALEEISGFINSTSDI